MPFGPRGHYRLLPSLSWQADPQIGRVLDRAGPGRRVVDLGAGGRLVEPGTLCVDFVPFPHTRVLGDVQRLPLRDACCDVVLGTGLLEHVVDERAVVAEMRRVLRPGGLAHLEVPFLEQYHQDPIDVRRLTVEGLELLVRTAGLEVVASGPHIGPTVTVVNAIARWWALVFEMDNLAGRVLSNGVFALLSVVLWPCKFLDRWLVHKRGAHGLAMGVYCTARKP